MPIEPAAGQAPIPQSEINSKYEVLQKGVQEFQSLMQKQLPDLSEIKNEIDATTIDLYGAIINSDLPQTEKDRLLDTMLDE